MAYGLNASIGAGTTDTVPRFFPYCLARMLSGAIACPHLALGQSVRECIHPV